MVTSSNGIRVIPEQSASCADCEWTGKVEMILDLEIITSFFVCPKCGNGNRRKRD